MFDGLDDEFEGLEEVEVVEGPGQGSRLLLSQAVEVTLQHRDATQHLCLAEGVCLLEDDRHHDVYQFLVGQQLRRSLYQH